MPYFRHHLFFCCNQRDPGDTCCANHDAEGMMRYARDRAKALGLALNATGGVRSGHPFNGVIDSFFR